MIYSLEESVAFNWLAYPLLIAEFFSADDIPDSWR